MKKLIAMVIVLCMVLGMMPVIAMAADGTQVYLKPNSNWKADNARFAIYYFGNGDGWADMTDSDGDGVYEAVVPAGYSSVIFCRMNPSAADNNWNNKWNQTSDLTVPTDGNNCYTVAEGTWDNGGGAWSAIDVEPEIPEPEYITVNAKVPADWGTNIYIYYWVGGAAWPGDTMTADGEWYTAQVLSTAEGIIINNGSSQTKDITGFTIGENKELWITVGEKDAEDAKFFATCVNTAPEATTEAPEATTEAPTTEAPEATTEAPEAELPSGSVTIESYSNIYWTAPASGTVQFTINPLTESIEVVDGWTPIASIAGSGTVSVTEGKTYTLATQSTTDISVEWAYVSLGESGGEGGVVGNPIDFDFGGINNNSGMSGTWTHTATEDGTLVLSNINFFNMNMEEQPNVYIVGGTGEPVVLESDDVYFHVSNGETVAVYIPSGCYGQLNVAWESGFVTAPVIKDGQYAISVVVLDDTHKVATAQSGKNYGYLYSPLDGVMEFGTLTVADVSLVYWTFTRVEGDTYTIQDAEDRYVYMSGTYNSFNFSAEVPAEGHIWSVAENTDGTYTIKNVLKDKTVAYSTNYSSYGCYSSVGTYIADLYLTNADFVQTPPPAGSQSNPIVIDSLPYSDTYTANQDLYYSWTADKDGNILVSVPSGALVSGLVYEEEPTDDGSVKTYIVPVTAGETYNINPWGGENDGTFTVDWEAEDAPEESTEAETTAPETSAPEATTEPVSEDVASGSNEKVNSSTDGTVISVEFTPDTDGILTVFVSGTPGFRLDVYEVTFVEGMVYDEEQQDLVPGQVEELISIGLRKETSEDVTNTYGLEAGKNYRIEIAGFSLVTWDVADAEITYDISFEAHEAPAQKEEWIEGSNAVDIGENSLPINPNANYTLYTFYAPEAGVYTFEVAGADISEWHPSLYSIISTSEDGTLTWTATAANQPFMFGLSGDAEIADVNIQKTGDVDAPVQNEYVDYENTHTPGKFEIPENADIFNVNVSEAHTAVLGDDGFYHLDSADGPVLYVDLITDAVSMYNAYYGEYGATSIRAPYVDKDGNVVNYNFYNSLKAYVDAANEDGLYPMTEDLAIFLQSYGASNGWFMPGLSPFEAINAENLNADSAWLVMCCYVVEAEVPETSVPEATTEAPEATTEAPEATTEAPEASTDAPEASTDAPEASTEAPEASTDAPEASTDAPEASTDAPEASTEAPEASTEAETPEATTEAETPEATTEAETPEATTEAPEATTEAPEATTEAPEATTEAPEATTEAPEATTEAPEETKPEETTKPEVTEITIKVTVPESWENPGIWAWDNAGNNAFDAWPGLALTKGDDGFWYATIPAWVENIIINGNGGSVQTADLALAQTKVDVNVTVTLAADGSVKAEMEYASPETGDATALTSMALVMLLAAAGFVTTVGSKKKYF